MGLSKEDTDVAGEVRLLELTTAAKKRRLRRQKLKAVRAGALDLNESIQQKPVLDTGPESTPIKTIAVTKLIQTPAVKLEKKKKIKSNVCLALNSSSNVPTLSSHQNIKTETSNTNLKTSSKDQVLTKSKTSTPKDRVANANIQNQEPKRDDTTLINNQNYSFECKSLNSETLVSSKSSKKQKSKTKTHDEKKQPEDQVHVENKKLESNSPVLKQNLTAADNTQTKKLKGKPESLILKENNSKFSEDLSSFQNQIPKEQELVKNHTTSLKSSEFENKDPESKKESSEKQAPNLDEIMGKSEDNGETQKQQQSKKEETASNDTGAKPRDDVKAAREAKKLAKLKAKKKNNAGGDDIEVKPAETKDPQSAKINKSQKLDALIDKTEKPTSVQPANDLKENIPPPEKTKTATKENKKPEIAKENVQKDSTDEKCEEGGKSKAELRAERRAKQEAQRAAKQASAQKTAKPDIKEPSKSTEEKAPKPKPVEKPKAKVQSVQRVDWFQQLKVEKDKNTLDKIAINSNLHPAVVKLGVQLASHVVSGSNARCIALLDALKKMVRDYSLPARTEFARGLQAQLSASEAFLWALRPPAASETNALKHFRRQLTLLPANVDEFDAKKKLQEEIDRYIREQIDMAGEAISLILRGKISPGDHVLTYGCSSLIERVLCEAWDAGARFRATVVGTRSAGGAREMLRRLRARRLPAAYADLSALSYVMADVQKVILGAGSLLANGAVLGAAGTSQVALVARERNVPVLVACETHKFSERLHIDPLVYSELGDPDALIDTTDENSPLKDWRSNPNLTLVNLMYDVTPPSLVTAVVTELGILPCTSAPVVLRFKLSEYGI